MSSHPVSELLVRWKAGDQEALHALMPLVYSELRDIARRHLRKERPEHTLQSAALVHEAYIRLADQPGFDVENRAHFFAVAARLMRQILVDHARRRQAAKRGADRRVELDASLVLPQEQSVDVIAMNDALDALSQLDEVQGRIVELRFFGGLEIEEIAVALGISRSTVKRDWNVAKAWLSRQMRREGRAESGTMAQD